MFRLRSYSALLVLLNLLTAVPGMTAGTWETFRGPRGTGQADEGLPSGQGPLAFELAWKRPLGSGYSGISVQEKALVTALRTVWSEAAHQLCQMHFMKNLSEPVHKADRKLRQTMRDRLSSLPAVPDLESKEATARVEHLVSEQDTQGEKKSPLTIQKW